MCSVPRGKAIIINNQKFDDPETFPFRLGANVDTDNLEQLFSQLSFEVIKYENLRRNETMKIMIDLADTVGCKESPCDMLIGGLSVKCGVKVDQLHTTVCMMSHGREHGKIVSSDCHNIDIEQDILRRFNNEYCPQLQVPDCQLSSQREDVTDLSLLFREHQSSSSCRPVEGRTGTTGLSRKFPLTMLMPPAQHQELLGQPGLGVFISRI